MNKHIPSGGYIVFESKHPFRELTITSILLITCSAGSFTDLYPHSIATMFILYTMPAEI